MSFEKILISLHIGTLISLHCLPEDPWYTWLPRVSCDGSDQTMRLCRLVLVFAERTCNLVGNVVARLIYGETGMSSYLLISFILSLYQSHSLHINRISPIYVCANDRYLSGGRPRWLS